MPRGIVLCIGTGNPDTSPKPEWADNRIYGYAPPGKIITHYQGAIVERDREPFYPLAVKEEPCDPRYGLLVIEDFIIRELTDKVLPVDDALANEFHDKLVKGNERAQSLVQRWTSPRVGWNHPNYGAMLLTKELPTDAEIKKCLDARRSYAVARLTEEKKNQTLRLQGARGYKAGWDAADLAWAEEFGFSIEIALDKVQRPPNSPDLADEGRVDCPFCAEAIKPQATKCRYCGKQFEKMTVAEFLATKLEREEIPA